MSCANHPTANKCECEEAPLFQGDLVARPEASTVTSNGELIKASTPAEETALKIARMRADALECSNHEKIREIQTDALAYIVQYLRNSKDLSNDQIKSLGSKDLSNVPEMIFAEKRRTVLLLGWIPFFGWAFACKYLKFKFDISFLKSSEPGDDIFKGANIEKAMVRSSGVSPCYY